MKLEFLDEFEEYNLMQGHYFMSLGKKIGGGKGAEVVKRISLNSISHI